MYVCGQKAKGGCKTSELITIETSNGNDQRI